MSIATTAPQPSPRGPSAATADYWAMTKPDINFLIAIVTFAGFLPGSARPELHGFPFLLLMQHPPRYRTRIERRELSEPIHRAEL